MSRKDPRKSLAICPPREIWVALKARSGCSMADTIRRAVSGLDWTEVPIGEMGKGTELSVQLPASELRKLDQAARSRGVSAELIVLGALAKALL